MWSIVWLTDWLIDWLMDNPSDSVAFWFLLFCDYLEFHNVYVSCFSVVVFVFLVYRERAHDVTTWKLSAILGDNANVDRTAIVEAQRVSKGDQLSEWGLPPKWRRDVTSSLVPDRVMIVVIKMTDLRYVHTTCKCALWGWRNRPTHGQQWLRDRRGGRGRGEWPPMNSVFECVVWSLWHRHTLQQNS